MRNAILIHFKVQCTLNTDLMNFNVTWVARQTDTKNTSKVLEKINLNRNEKMFVDFKKNNQ